MEPKSFFDTFNTLSVKNDLKMLFEEVVVKKVSINRDRTICRVYIHSDYLIEKKYIYKMQESIKLQLFSKMNVEVKIIEDFRLGEVYDVKTLYEIYNPSILEEIKEISQVLYVLYKKAQCEIEGNKIQVNLPNTPLARDMADELKAFLVMIFVQRCGIDVCIDINFELEFVDEFSKANDILVAREVAAIAASAGYVQEELSSAENFEPEASAGLDDGQKASLDAIASSARSSDGTDKAASNAYEEPNVGRKQKGAKGKQPSRPMGLRRSDNKEVVYGIDFDDNSIPILDVVDDEANAITIRGKIIRMDEKPIRNEKTVVMIDITDFEDTISAKLFIRDDQLDEFRGLVKVDMFVKLKGVAAYDPFDRDVTISRIKGIKTIPDFTTKRMDYSVNKRIELHCHTKLSDMDGVTDASKIVKTACEWGHSAIAITDHGVVQSFIEAYHTWEDLFKEHNSKRKAAGEPPIAKEDFFKIIYGMEAYIVDDLAQVVVNPTQRLLDDTYVVFDIETTGFSAVKNNITEIGAVKISKGEIVDTFSTFVNPNEPIPYRITQLTHITDEMVKDAPNIDEVLPRFLEFAGDATLVAHNASFDMSFIKECARRQGLSVSDTYIDTLELSREMLPHLSRYKLDVVCEELGVSLEGHHRAVNDAQATAQFFVILLARAKAQGALNLVDLNNIGDRTEDREERLINKVKKLKNHHAIILAKNNTGRVNLYTLVSKSHLLFMHRNKPCIPKSLLNEYREGLILGSACEAGELYSAIVDERSDEEIATIAQYYDYLEIQPCGNNMFMVKSDKYPNINSLTDVQDINKKIVELGDRLNKLVVATCDVHFLNPEDEIYRRIIMAGQGFSDADDQAPLYLRTTEEMLEEFAYLGTDRANEIVITNPLKIADMCDVFSPVRPDKCPPVIENSDKTLREICYTKAKSMYGDPLPEVVQARLERELGPIISNGYSVMYIIAQKLVWKSIEDGYLVGSRGSVGSSFVATMSGITEVNPLSPHYYCHNCHFTDFDSKLVRKYVGMAGVDMPDRDCPNCGQKLSKDGFDIPFETFLGFEGDKEPDIDLNFSGEYQSNAHKYTEVIFGKGQTFKAGTISTVADKTAYGYVSNYFREKNVVKRSAEINRIVPGCVGIRRGTGQHPGGIVVLPKGEDMNTFTPIQYPANKVDSGIITTHFDYHSIDHNLLKLDILGHDDPTMIRMLQDLIGIDPTKIPLDDPKVMSLFQSTQALGISPSDIDGTELGCLGIPEFGTQFAIGMLVDAKPKAFSDLVRISGLSHGTNVWQGNAEILIKEGTATISTAICTRDDIMTYLINMGVESSRAFKIMENVRKGRVAKGKCPEWDEWKQDILAHNVPDWYVWSCEKIEYMFPKAHAAAYVMMAWRIAYCKIYYPLEYYAAFYSIRAVGFDYEMMCFGKEKVDALIDKFNIQKDEGGKRTATEKDVETSLRIVQEMYARKIEFVPIDLKVVKPSHFSVVDGKIMASLTSIAGLGEAVACNIVEAVKGEPFLSKADFRARTKASTTITDKLQELGVLTGLPETNQFSLFDFM